MGKYDSNLSNMIQASDLLEKNIKAIFCESNVI